MNKKCMCCGLLAAADAPHCPNCGEGSWGVVESPPAPKPALVAAPVATPPPEKSS